MRKGRMAVRASILSAIAATVACSSAGDSSDPIFYAPPNGSDTGGGNGGGGSGRSNSGIGGGSDGGSGRSNGGGSDGGSKSGYTVTITQTGNGTGSVYGSLVSPGSTCSTTNEWSPPKSFCSFQAAPGSKWHFTAFADYLTSTIAAMTGVTCSQTPGGGGGVGTSALQCDTVVNSNLSVTVDFVRASTLYTVTVVSPGSKGVIEGPNLLYCGTGPFTLPQTCSLQVASGVVLDLSGYSSASHSAPLSWIGCSQIPTFPERCVLTVTGNATVSAKF
jgi:hypothetical protein